MITIDLTDKRVLITQSDFFMGPALVKVFKKLGAVVIEDTGFLNEVEKPDNLIKTSGRIDILLANLGVPAASTLATDVCEKEWNFAFSHMVDPLFRITKAVLPQMISRQEGKIILIGSASALKGIKKYSTYSAARGAQLAYIQSVGVEVAKNNIQINAIAQNYVDNEMYFPEKVKSNPIFKQKIKNDVPLGRLVTDEEDAYFAAYLCSDLANCFVGQIFPVCGGWVNR